MSPLPLVLAVALSAACATTDVRRGTIPNELTLGTLCVAPLAHFAWTAAHFGLREGCTAAAASLAGALVCGLVPYGMFRAGAMFGGDVKLLAALGAVCRPLVGIEVEFYAFIAAAILGMGQMAWDGRLLQVLGNTLTLVANPFRPAAARRPLPDDMMTLMRFGPSVFVGMLVATVLHWNGP